MDQRLLETPDPNGNRRLFLTMALCLLIYSAWVWWRGPIKPPEPAPEVAPVAAAPAAPVPAPVAPAPAPEVPQPPATTLPFSACDASGSWTSAGGALRGVTLDHFEAPYTVTPIWTWVIGRATGSATGGWEPYGTTPGPGPVLTARALGFTPGAGLPAAPPLPMEVLESGPDRVTFRGTTADGVQILERLEATGQPCAFDLKVIWKNTAGSPYNGGVWVALHDDVPVEGGGRYSNAAHPEALVGGSLVSPKLSTLKDAPQPQEGDVSWFAVTTRYFGAFALPHDPAAGHVVFDQRLVDDAPIYGSHWIHDAAIAPGEAFEQEFRVYLGALDTDVLVAVDPSLKKAVNYGWMAAFAGPMLWLLKQVEGLIGNWGWAIVALTILVKAALFPVINSGMKSSMKMAAVQPRIQAVKEKYKNEPEEQNRQVMALFKEAGANPLGGCLPLLFQVPVFASLYGVLLSAPDLYHARFLYLRDLSSPDPYGILPLATVALMWGQQQLMPMTNMDPAQARVMQFVPLMFGLFFFTAPSGLGVYMVVNISLSILQQWWIRRQFPQTPVTAPA
jgi:YidC/Oxa1 family membrane protein insertase